ncbi:MAG TPA: hypothetical protein PKO06_20355, partial [Candidatus Ozemobacteraceae bacterium]|nr:hypothetical protein [Candidatus Ozemobacteraceae bacterium]
MTAPLVRELRRWLLILLFTGLPLYLIWLVFERQEHDREQEAVARSLDGFEVFAKAHWGDHGLTSQITLYLRWIYEESLNQKDALAAFRERFRELQQHIPGFFEALVLRADGTLAEGFDSIPELSPIMLTFGREYQRFRQGDPKPLQRRFVEYRSLFGPFVSGSLEYATFTGIYLRSFSQIRSFFWHSGLRFDERSPFYPLVFISTREGFELLGLRVLRLLLQRWLPTSRATIIDLERPLARWRLPAGISASQIRQSLLERRDHDRHPWFEQDHAWLQIPCNQRYRLLVSL